MKKLISAVLAVVTLLCAAACNPTVTPQTTEEVTSVKETETAAETTGEVTETGAVTEEPIVDEDPVFYDKITRDPVDFSAVDFSKTDWNSTIDNANETKNIVGGKFTDDVRSKFLIYNGTSSLLYNLSETGKKQVETLYNAEGKPYFTNTMDAYVVNSAGVKFSGAYSYANARMNSNRLGYYYYDFRFRDQDLIEPGAATNEGDYYDIIDKTKVWSGSPDITKLTSKRGVINYTVKSSIDPYIMSNVNYSADEYDAVRITIKAETSASAYIYLIAGSKKEYNQEQSIGFRFIAGRECTVVVPLSALPDYNGKVTGFRIDCGTEGGEKVVISEIKALKRKDVTIPLALERIFHTYPDKMHDVVRVVAISDYSDGGVLETQTVIPADTVRKFVIKNKNGEVSSLDGFDFDSTEYVGFDINGAGVYGIIMPVAENNGYIRVELKDGNYVITRGIEIKETIKKGRDLRFGHRIYTSSSHQFNDLRKEAYVERNPLTDIKIMKEVDNASYKGYDALMGSYMFTCKGTEFATAFKNGDKQFLINAAISGDGVTDRKIYVQTAENLATRRGRIECAAFLDENDRMLPLPLEVGKNFDGENEEPLYYPEKGTGAAAFGEVYVPLTVGKDECKKFTMVHLYQNWGKYPLKQISFIAFHIPYYHISVGVTETNCITPYYVFGKDGFMLPDFRANSAPFWENNTGTQHTSIGRLYFLQYNDKEGKLNKTESQSANIKSSGPVYADITMNFLSDDNKIKATYRHAEMAQTDETRTYYHVKYEVQDDVSIADFKKDFALFKFDSYTVTFAKMGYLDENGKQVIEDVKGETDRYVKLGKEYPYYDYFGGNIKESVNFGLIVRSSDITINGKKYDGGFIVHDQFDGIINTGTLTLDLGEVTLKKGDVIEFEMILLPWGYSTSKNDDNVRNVRADSCVDPYKITVIEGEAVDDTIIPSVKAKDNKAVFKISGGRSTAAVRVYGFKDYTKPEISFKADGKPVEIELAGVNGYDGYQVSRDDDGTYSFSFNVDMNKAKEYEITVKQ